MFLRLNSILFDSREPLTIDMPLSDCFLKVEKSIYRSLPVCSDDLLLGIISSEDLISFEEDATPLKDHLYLIGETFVSKDVDWMTCFKKIINAQVPILPVMDKGFYLGYFDSLEFIGSLGDNPSLMEDANDVLIHFNPQHNSIAKLTHSIEQHRAEILLMFSLEKTESRNTLYLRIKSIEINEILQVLRAQNYHILSNHLDDTYRNELKDRSDYLNKFLNV